MEHLPEQFQDATREEQTQIAHLGIQGWEILKKEISKIKELDYTKLSDKLKEEGRKEGRREADREVARVLKEKEYAFDDLQAQFGILEKKLQRVETEKEKELVDLEKRIRKDAERDQESIAREAALLERSKFMEQVKEYEVSLAQLNAREDWKLAYLENQKTIAKLEQQLENYTKIRSSYEIGQEGEEETESMLCKIPEWDCERVSKEKDRADFRMTYKDKTSFILDSKKYVNAVPKKERDKLMSNVDDDATVSGGILVSLDSKITTKENCEIETTPGKKVVCYLNLAGMTTDAKIAYIGSTLKFLYQYVASHDEREKNELLERLLEGATRLGELKKETENMRNKAKEVYESLKLNVGKIQSIMDYISNKPVEITPSASPQQPKVTKKTKTSSQ